MTDNIAVDFDEVFVADGIGGAGLVSFLMAASILLNMLCGGSAFSLDNERVSHEITQVSDIDRGIDGPDQGTQRTLSSPRRKGAH